MKKTEGNIDVGDFYMFARETIRHLGREAMTFHGKGQQSSSFDKDLVTQAELHLNQTFTRLISERYSTPPDGVDNFQSDIPIWGMSLALYENFWPVLGLFYMPATNDLFRGCAGSDAYWNDRVIRINDHGAVSQESLLLTFSRFHQHYRCRFPGKIRDFGSTGAHACYVAMGRADAAFTANESFKDLAAVNVIVEAAGGKLYKIDGGKFFLGDYVEGQRSTNHLMIASKINAAPVLKCLTPR